jgi:hypothetical protein
MLSQRRFPWLALAPLSLAAVLSFSNAAHAGGKLAVDVDAALPTDSPKGVDNGWGAGVRLGHQWDLLLVNLTPEFGFHYTSFGGAADMTAWNAVAGGRLGIGLILEPSVFAHAGLGHYGGSIGNADFSQTSLGYDFGVALDLTVLPIIDIGAHATWMGIAGDKETDPLNWVAVGGHIAFSIPGL